MATNEEKLAVPEGMDFLHLVWGMEDSCEASTDASLPSLGKKAPACLEHIGTVLSLLDRMASCWWTCRKGDHLVEYLCGRAASNARAALRLMRLGFYDEALSLSRAMGETSNLFQLFATEGAALEEWSACSRQQRMQKFSPVKVRLRLAKTTGPIVTEARYAALSERSSHVQPETRPQAHNILGIPTLGADVQAKGILVCLNEIALPLGVTATFGSYLLELDRNDREHVESSAESLIDSMGRATILEIDDYHRQVLEAPASREALTEVARILRQAQDER